MVDWTPTPRTTVLLVAPATGPREKQAILIARVLNVDVKQSPTQLRVLKAPAPAIRVVRRMQDAYILVDHAGHHLDAVAGLVQLEPVYIHPLFCVFPISTQWRLPAAGVFT